MARTFVAASSQYLRKASAVVTAMPLTMAFWANFTTVPASNFFMLSIDASAAKDAWWLMYDAAGTSFCAAIDSAAAGGGDFAARGGLALSTNTWYHACAVFTSATSRDIYTNGAHKVSSTVSVSPSAPNQTEIGAGDYEAGGIGSYFNGIIAFPAIWNVALSATDITSLAAGASPRLVHPEALKSYCRLTGGASPEPDYVNSTGYTLTGTPAESANPPIYTP